MIGLYIVVVEILIIADEEDAGLKSHALVSCNDLNKRTISSNDIGKIEEKIIFKIQANK